MNGLWGFKPTSKRLSYIGVPVSTEGQEHVPSAVGPMTRSLMALIDVLKAVIKTEPWRMDPSLPPIPWNDEVFSAIKKRPIVFGLMPDDGVVKTHPPIQRVFDDTVEKLTRAGHKVVAWDSRLHAECIAIMVRGMHGWSGKIALLTNIGRILHRRRRRRHPQSRRNRRRALPTACAESYRSSACNIRISVLAAEQA